jgi:hypothetical protein
VIQELLPREHLPRVAHQCLEQGELSSRELDRSPIDLNAPRVEVEHHTTVDDCRRVRLIRRPQSSPDPGEELVETERLREVIVRDGVEVRDSIGDGILGS